MSGWVKFSRKVWDHPRVAQNGWLNIWAYLLCTATHKPIKKLFAGSLIELNPGQLITGRNVISKETGVNRSTVDRLLACMESEHQIEQQMSNKSRLISIKNWEKYQGQENDEPQIEPQMSIKRAATEPQLSTLQEVKELKNKEREGVPPRERKVATFTPSRESLVMFTVWKSAFPHDDAPRQQTCKNIMARLKAYDRNQLVFCILKYANRVKKDTEAKPDGRVMTYKGSNFFGEKAYYETYLPMNGETGRQDILEKLTTAWAFAEASTLPAPSSPGTAGQGSAADSIQSTPTGE